MANRKDVKYLGSDIEVLMQKHKKMSTLQVRRIAVAAGSSVIAATPVDTGKARGNWVASKNSLSLGGSTEKGAVASISKLSKVASSFTSKDTAIFVVNNLSYIRRLNNGWSQQQAVPGWIQRCVSGAASKVKGWMK